MDVESIRVSVSVDDRSITLEGPRDFVEAEVRRLTDQIATTPQPERGAGRDLAPEASFSSEKELVEAKAPHGHMETVAVLAFALTENGLEEFTEEDIRRAYIRAGVRPPKVVAQALRDARNNKDFIEAGSERGKYRLSHHGDRFVRFDLPRGQ